MKILKSIAVAFSIYSKIPMPRFDWGTEDMKYQLLFFPWVGAVIGGLEWGLWLLKSRLELGSIFYIMLAAALPIIITGGFHIDGYMDTCDAMHSYQPKERKLEILKDPHIGAFAVICLLGYTLIGLGFLSQIASGAAIAMICCSFFATRALSGISILTMRPAKDKGMLNTFSATAQGRVVLVGLIIQLALCVMGMFFINLALAIVSASAIGLSYLYYFLMSRRQFGGITGDLAGFFVSVAELVVVVAMGAASIACR